MDERAFVEALMAAVPEAFEAPLAREHYLEGEPLTYPALGDARIWLEDHAIKVSLLGRGARVRSGRADVVRRFWDFVEQQARAGAGDVELETLLHPTYTVVSIEIEKWRCTAVALAGMRIRAKRSRSARLSLSTPWASRRSKSRELGRAVAPAAAAGERERDDGRDDSGCQDAAYRGIAPCTSTAC